MERHRTIRAYSAGGVVFRLVPAGPAVGSLVPDHNYATDLWGSEPNDTYPLDSIPVEPAAELAERVSILSQPAQMYRPLATNDMAVEVALVGRSRAGVWALPKGTPQPGETIEQVAIREVQEETGLKVRMIAYIGSISYSFVRDRLRYQKQVRHFLMEAVGGDTALHDQEYDLVEWFPISEACRRLTYQNEVNILYQAEDVLQRWLEYQRKEGQK